MDTYKIAEVAIDSAGRLRVFPVFNSYPMIYREGVEVQWDSDGRFLYSPKPREWTYLHWFQHIIGIAGGLALSTDTRWTNVPDELRREVEAWMKQRK
jgi:hypothetical protein